MKELKFIFAIDDKIRFHWESRVYLHSLQKYGYTNVDVLIFSSSTIPSGEWAKMKQEYPFANFFFYPDLDGITRLTNLFNYVPLFRPYILKKHWEKFPELKDKAVFYTDSDIVFTKYLDFTPFLEDDVCYLSDTKSYINSDYFKSKSDLNPDGGPKYVHPQKFEQFKKRDILEETAKICGISKGVCEDNKNNSGGAQYLLKNITAEFWEEMMSSCMTIKLHLSEVNQQFMQGKTPNERENNGFQSFCADMWALLYTLWAKGHTTITPKELDFAWSTDEIASHPEYILHNAGVTSDAKIRTRIKDENKNNIEVEAPIFYKGAYIAKHPMSDAHKLREIISNPISNKYHTSTYIQNILDTFTP
jgi:hypothetical protein